MAFGYNSNAAFGNTTAGIIDHAKSLLSGLIDKREEDGVSFQYLLDRDTRTECCSGIVQTCYIYRLLVGWNSD